MDKTYWTFGHDGGEYSTFEAALHAAITKQFDDNRNNQWANAIDLYKVDKVKVFNLPSRSNR